MGKFAFVFLFVLVFISNSSYSSEICTNLFKEDPLNSLYLNLRNQNSAHAETYSLYLELVAQHPILGKVFKKRDILEVLLDEELSSRGESLTKLFKSLSNRKYELSESTLATILERHLLKRVPEETIPERVGSFLNGAPNSLIKVLGDMTLSEVQLLTYGKDPLKPSPESLLGQYIANTAASTVVRSFSMGPRRKSQGEKRLVVAVSEASFAEYLRLFKNVHFLIHVHTPEQGTLHVAQNGRHGSYGGLQNALRNSSIGTIMPHILLSSTEANRVTNFFKLGALNVGGQPALRPWSLKGKDDVSYCARGGYSSCTHWFGNIPMGDKKVEGYSFPGKVDSHADRDVPKGRQYKELVPYNFEGTKDQLKLMNLVWQVPGHEQLSSVLGLEHKNVSGEFASPGFVAVSLTAAAPVQRVPVVFLITKDHQAEIMPDFDPSIHAF
ncbi:MAG: hypothetical protein V4596_00825 [Bdellovibrionota bacterium]